MKKSILIVLFAFSALVANAGTPKMPSKCEAFRPQELGALILKKAEIKKLMSKSDYGQNTPPAQGMEAYWTVYSDRDNNQTYEAPSLSAAKCTTLSFNETLRIAQIKGNFALVYEEPNKQVVYPEISHRAVCKGWVPMSNLLLWQSCLANEAGIYNKALLCVNLESISADPTKAVGVGYREPSTKSKPVYLETDINFYFIMKEENGMALLATQSKMDGGLTDQVLYFWVPTQSYVAWNQRSCLEPTWKIDDVEYFAAKQIVAPVYGNVRLSGDQISKIRYELQDRSNVKPSEQQYFYRMEGNSLRYPILDDGTDAIYNMSTFSSSGEAAGTKSKKKTPEEIADSIKKARLEKMQHINLAIVIDGTSSMEPYYPAVKDAIKEGVKFFSEGYKIKVGVVIYRDYDDGEGLCEVMPLTSINHIERFNDFLDRGGNYGIKSSPKDKTNEEALFYGINMALDTLRFNDGESNMMLVVGDCGNVENDRNPSEAEIIAKMSKLNIHPMSFQVQNQNQPAWNSFNNQMNKMFRLSLTQNYKQISDSVKLSPHGVMANGILDGYDFKANVAEQLYIGMTRYANANVNDGKKDPKLLTDHVAGSILEFANTIQKQITMIATAGKQQGASMFAGGAKQGGNLDISDAFIKQRLGEEYAKAVKESGALLNFSGFVSKKKFNYNK